MTDSMIERVGNVIAARLTIAIATGNLSMQDIARAAIEAMRTPTLQMQEAGVGSLTYNVGDISDQTPKDAANCWTAMIDASLNEKPAANHSDGPYRSG